MIHRRFFPLRFLGVVAIAAFVAALPSAATAQDRGDNTLRKLNESVDALIKKVSPSVVQILVSGYGPVESSEHGNTATVIGRQRAIGSGFVIDPTGYIVTNAHVVAGAQRIQIVVPEGPSDGSLAAILATRTNIVPARVVGVDKEIDLALLK
ncbi:MAG TPA: trypsin-like peptidase domain-containing protein, partial [Candidatus Acidoferrum sp.]|nr:trypsin-like peptidase domain-containing protein [Candidatus Acidoferrum sp.]